ncbi:MAG: DUF364 domain-containing protein [Candidatus Riflebacteria bacterium]|nr:DUF364 domain-containing protein [Candidatus Riflebacteria bacterium]
MCPDTARNLRQRLVALAREVPEVPVRRVVVGVHMTAVASHTVGCAYTWREEVGAAHLCAEIRGGGRLRGLSAQELAGRLTSTACLERSLGMAAVNSLITRPTPDWQEGDILAWMKSRFAGARIGMVGHFPFAPEIRSWAGEFHVVEKRPVEDDLPEEKGAAWLASCDAVIITGVTLLNDTLPGIIRAASKAWKLMLGPTVPPHPLLLDLGIDALASIVCTDEEAYWPFLEEGAIVPRYLGTRPVLLARERLPLPPGDFRQRLSQALDKGQPHPAKENEA